MVGCAVRYVDGAGRKIDKQTDRTPGSESSAAVGAARSTGERLYILYILERLYIMGRLYNTERLCTMDCVYIKERLYIMEHVYT